MKSGCWVIEQKNKKSKQWEFYQAYKNKKDAQKWCGNLSISWGMKVRVRRYVRDK